MLLISFLVPYAQKILMGSVDIAPVIEMSHLILSNVLATSGSLMIDGKAGFTALIDVIRNEGIPY